MSPPIGEASETPRSAATVENTSRQSSAIEPEVTSSPTPTSIDSLRQQKTLATTKWEFSEQEAERLRDEAESREAIWRDYVDSNTIPTWKQSAIVCGQAAFAYSEIPFAIASGMSTLPGTICHALFWDNLTATVTGKTALNTLYARWNAKFITAKSQELRGEFIKAETASKGAQIELDTATELKRETTKRLREFELGIAPQS